MTEPTQEFLKQTLGYDRSTGILTWKERPSSHFDKAWKAGRWNRRHAGAQAGTTAATNNGKKYCYITIAQKTYMAHRIIWMLETGSFPSEDIDHIDGDGSNNALSNLRAVSPQDNHKNYPLRKDSTSGITGVSWDKKNKKWVARIFVGGKKLHLGRFSVKADAAVARKEADIKYSFHPNHGTTRPPAERLKKSAS
jgi:hypothetical protein